MKQYIDLKKWIISLLTDPDHSLKLLALKLLCCFFRYDKLTPEVCFIFLNNFWLNHPNFRFLGSY